MVVILVSMAGHLETSALENARKLMQGGLDRIPRTARKVLNPSIKLAKPEPFDEFHSTAKQQYSCTIYS